MCRAIQAAHGRTWGDGCVVHRGLSAVSVAALGTPDGETPPTRRQPGSQARPGPGNHPPANTSGQHINATKDL